MQIIAHRGASAECPENTLAAVDRAIEIGADAIEIDLLISRDRRLVVRHDDLIEKDGAWCYVGELTLAELRTIDLGDGERIPDLVSVLDRVGGRCPLIVDIKSFGTAPLLAEVVDGREDRSGIRATSFLHSEIAELGRLCPWMDRSINLAAVPLRFDAILEGTGATAAGLFRGYLNEEIVRDLHAGGVRVLVYPVNLKREAVKFSSWGVDGIYTDDPRAMRGVG